eukprot:4554252-Amphidinium_carterae.1
MNGEELQNKTTAARPKGNHDHAAGDKPKGRTGTMEALSLFLYQGREEGYIDAAPLVPQEH